MYVEHGVVELLVAQTCSLCGHDINTDGHLSRYDTYKEELSTVVSGAASHNVRVAAKKAAKEAAKEHHEG